MMCLGKQSTFVQTPGLEARFRAARAHLASHKVKPANALLSMKQVYSN